MHTLRQNEAPTPSKAASFATFRYRTCMADTSRPQECDDVDAILEAWHRELPDVDTSPMQILSRVSRLTRRLDLMRRKAFGTQALEAWEFDVLAALRRSGAPYALTPGALMEETLVASGTMTNRIDRLEQSGLVVRTPSEQDRRAVLVSLTPQGRERVDEALRTLVAFEDSFLAGLSATERGDLAGLLRKLLTSIEGS